jgi:hypothetical protein
VSFRPAPRIHEPAVRGRPVVDAAGWTAEELAANDDWIYALSPAELDELRDAVAGVTKRGLDILEIDRAAFPLPTLDRALAMLQDELRQGRGFFLLRGVPVAEFSRAEAAAAFWGIGLRLGRPVAQNGKGQMLGHVKDFGVDYRDPKVRGYQTAAEMSYHCDQCDYVGLICLHPAKSGGASRIASTVTIYNRLLARDPKLAEALVGDFYLTRHDEAPPLEPPWYKLPMMSFQDGWFASRSPGTQMWKALELPGVPPLTELQKEACAAFRELAIASKFDMEFRQGDIQVLHSHVTVHTRTAFEDYPEEARKRHLMRLWLMDDAGRPLLPGHREALGTIHSSGVTPCAPVEALEPA